VNQAYERGGGCPILGDLGDLGDVQG